ncbi:MAG TPA: hypothetical protein VES19_04345 [Candidatus Limnocylindrales bacterium]|nr:hypothetical protein [Candidatus Limnocylindrales bacterium]
MKGNTTAGRSLVAACSVALVVACAPDPAPELGNPAQTTAPPSWTSDPLATESQVVALLPPGSTLVLVSDDTGARPDQEGAFNLGRLGDAGTMAVVMACDGEGPLQLDVVSDQSFVPTPVLGLSMTTCVPGGALDMSQLAVGSPDDWIVIHAPPATRWRVAIART